MSGDRRADCQRGAKARWANVPKEERARIMAEVARKRWDAKKKQEEQP